MKSEVPHLTGSALVLATIALALGNAMTVLDTTITNVSVPTIAGNLGISANEGTWVITTYAVAEAITMPLTGWLVKRVGQVRLFVASVLAFVLFSLLCGLAWSLESLVLFLVLQGLAGGPIIPLSSTLMIAIFPKDKSSIAVALWGMTTVAAPIAGPVLGGWICDNYEWPWIFLINIPVGILIAIGVWHLMSQYESEIEHKPIDVMGLGLLVAFVTSLQLMLDKGREYDWFASTFIVACAIISVLSLILLVIWELTDENPILDLSVFTSRNWVVSTLVLALMFGLFFGHIVISPLWLQQQLHYTAFWAGLAVAPMGILAVATSPVVGKLIPKMDSRWIVTAGMVILAVSFYLRAVFTSEVDYGSIAVPMIVIGAGIPACLVTLISMGTSALPPEKAAGGSGLQNFLRIMSMAIGSSLSQTYWEHMTKVNRAELVAIIDYDAIPGGLTGENSSAALNQFSRIVDTQSMMLATNDFYALATVLILIFAAAVWLVKPVKISKVQNH